MPQTIPAPLQTFVDAVNQQLATGGEESSILPRIGDAMRTLVAEDNWLDDAYAQPHPQYYQQYLLHADPDDRFSVVSFVWGPGQETPIHDHTVWGVIGMLRGDELAQGYQIAADGVPQATGEEVRLQPGDVEFVSPTLGDVHRVRNAFADRPSISIHAYGANIGKVQRHVFPPEGGAPKDFVSGYTNPVV